MITLPVDDNFKVIQTTPATAALSATYDSSISSSTQLVLNANTSYLEITAIDKGIFMKWGGTASSSSFDEYILKDSTRCFMIPEGQTTVEFIEQSASAILVAVEK